MVARGGGGGVSDHRLSAAAMLLLRLWRTLALLFVLCCRLGVLVLGDGGNPEGMVLVLLLENVLHCNL